MLTLPHKYAHRVTSNVSPFFALALGKQGWLETHLWHAKRFAMTQQTDLHYADWRHRVAIQPSDKSFRACYRAVAKHCLIQVCVFVICAQTEQNCLLLTIPILNTSK